MSKGSNLVAALDGEVAIGRGTPGRLRVHELFGDRPEVIEAIIRARRDRKLSYGHIAETLNRDPDIHISEGAVKSFLKREGIS